MALIFSADLAWAASSENYKIQADVIGAGGSLGDSETYKLTDTLGEAVVGEGTSATYKTKAGFHYLVNTYLTLAVDNNTKDLGSLLSGSPITGQTTATVTTDSWGGYALNVSKDHPMRHTDNVTEITDHAGTLATPLLWQAPNNSGFGFTIVSGTDVEAKWGASPNYKYAAFPALAATAHAKSGFKSGADDTVFGYKVDAPTDQKSGAYSCVVTYTAVAAL